MTINSVSASSISLNEIQNNKNLTNKQKDVLSSIFEMVDNKKYDEDKREGFIAGETAIEMFKMAIQNVFESACNTVLSALGLSEEVQAQQNNDMPTTGDRYARMDNNGNTTVYHQNGKVEYYGSNKTQNSTTRQINGNGVSGNYSITEDENGGYQISHNLSINNKNPLKNKFQTTPPNVYEMDDGSILVEKLGFNANDFDEKEARRELNNKVNDFINNHAIYTDLLQRQKSGEQLSNAELKFIALHQEEMKKVGLKFDENGNINININE